MPQCVAYGCSNRKEAARSSKLTFHKFPLDINTRNKWIKAIRRLHWKPTRNSYLCSIHFQNNDFDRSSPFRVYLKKGAVPSIFPGFPKLSKVNLTEDGTKNKRQHKRRLGKQNKEVNEVEDISNDNRENIYSKCKQSVDEKESSKVTSEIDSLEGIRVKPNNGCIRRSMRAKKLTYKRACLEAALNECRQEVALKKSPKLKRVQSFIDDDVNSTTKEHYTTNEKSKFKKLFDEDAYLKDICNEQNSFFNEGQESDNEKSVSVYSASVDVVEEAQNDPSQTLETILNDKEVTCEKTESYLTAHDNSSSKNNNCLINNENVHHDLSYRGFNLVTSQNSRLEDFAEIISEERSQQKTDISYMGRNNISTVKKVIRVSMTNICRVCGKLSDLLLPIFGDGAKKHHIPNLIYQYLPIKVVENDTNRPKKVCESCIRQLVEWNQLIGKCKQVDVMLAKMLGELSDETQTKSKHVEESSQHSEICNIENKCLTGFSDKHDRQNYKIGITLVKDKYTELDLSSLHSILISKVNQIFQSISFKKDIEESPSITINYSSERLGHDNENDSDNNSSEFRVSDLLNTKHKGRKSKESNNIRKSKSKSEMLTCLKNEKISFFDRLKRKKNRADDISESFLCSDCGNMGEDHKSYLKHRRMYHIEKKCRYCGMNLQSLYEYRRHLRSAHLDKISNSCCEICGTTFTRRERLQRHKLIIHNIGEYLYCDICNKKCASRQQLYCHKSDMHNKKENLCSDCGQSFASHQAYIAHLKKKHSYKKELMCDRCGKSFSSSVNLSLHSEKCNNEIVVEEQKQIKVSNKIMSANNELYSCLICSVKITDIETLKSHMNFHADDDIVKALLTLDTGDFKCNLCEKCFGKEKELALHRFYDHQEAPFICSIEDCNISYWKRMSLILHQMTVHKIRNNTCKFCSESFRDLKEKRHHIKLHHSSMDVQAKRFVCTVCNRRFCYESTLKTHMVIHSDVKLYKCNLCEKEFKLKLTLSKHMQYHQRKQEEKDNTCRADEATAEVSESEITKEPATANSEEAELTVMNEPEVINICTMFKCSDCNILFTDKGMRDAHCIEAHASSNHEEENGYEEIDNVVHVTLPNNTEFTECTIIQS